MPKSKDGLSINNQLEFYKNAMDSGTIPDYKNPIAIVQIFPVELLLDIALGRLDMKQFAIHELEDRGIGKKGEWVGFCQAEAIWKKSSMPKAANRKRPKRL